jgi:hypothetical protein
MSPFVETTEYCPEREKVQCNGLFILTKILLGW